MNVEEDPDKQAHEEEAADEDEYDDKMTMTPLGSSCHESPLPPCSLPSHSPLPGLTPDSPASMVHANIKMENNNNSLMESVPHGGLLTKIKTEDGDYTDYDKEGVDSIHTGDSDKLEQENRSPDEAGKVGMA